MSSVVETHVCGVTWNALVIVCCPFIYEIIFNLFWAFSKGLKLYKSSFLKCEFSAIGGKGICGSGVALDGGSASRSIDHALGAWYRTKFISSAHVVPGPVKLYTWKINRGLKHHSFPFSAMGKAWLFGLLADFPVLFVSYTSDTSGHNNCWGECTNMTENLSSNAGTQWGHYDPIHVWRFTSDTGHYMLW